MQKGLIHIYTGNGKGKTSAALGLVVRAVGYGKRIKYVRFVKSGFSGELKTLAFLADWIDYEQANPFETSIFALSVEEEQQLAIISQKVLEKLVESMQHYEYDIYVFDEIFAALKRTYLTKEMIQRLIDNKPEGVELVLTGREAPEDLIVLADYVTVMEKEKHPFDQEIPAREGIEY